MNEAIVLAGGLGTRLQKVVADVPKPMALVNEIPFLEYIIRYLSNFGIDTIILSVGYKYEVIERHFGNEFRGVKILYAIENEPLGTGGAISLSLEKAKGNEVLIMNGDTFFDVNINELYDFYQRTNSKTAVALREVEDVSRYGAVIIDDQGVLVDYLEKSASQGQGWINGGMYILNRVEYQKNVFERKYSFEKDYLEKFAGSKLIYGKKFNSYFIDIGVPEDYYRAQVEFVDFKY